MKSRTLSSQAGWDLGGGQAVAGAGGVQGGLEAGPSPGREADFPSLLLPDLLLGGLWAQKVPTHLGGEGCV